MAPREKGRALSKRGTEFPDRIDERIIKLPGQLRDWQVKCVCGGTHQTCNGGWMKKIEDEAKPIMTPLILGQSRRLSPKDQEVIAAWAVLKSIVTNYDGEAKIVTHHMQRKFLKRHRRAPDKGWGVWICNFDRQNWKTEWVSRPFRILPDKQAAKHADGRIAFYNGNATTQFIGKLLIHVINTTAPRRIERWNFPVPPRGIIVRIWPSRKNYSLLWPPTAITTDEADRIPDMFIDWLKSLPRPPAA